MTSFLAAGDVLVNADLLAFAVVETDTEGHRLRLGFRGTSNAEPSEIVLSGLEARSVLRWLRVNASFLDAGGPSTRRKSPEATQVGWRTTADL